MAGEESIVLQQIHGHLGAGQRGFPRFGPVGFGAHIDPERIGVCGTGTVDFDGAVSRADDAHIVA
jgi:hypothetical protein